MTTPFQIERAKKIATELQDALNPKYPVTVNVDDWSDYSSFRIFITFNDAKISHALVTNNGFNFNANLRSIGWTIKRILSKYKVVIEFIEMPRRVYWAETYGRKVFAGYENPYIKLDFTLI